MVTEDTGEVSLIGENLRCEYQSSAAFDLTESSYHVRVRAGANPPSQVSLSVRYDENNAIDAQTEGEELHIVETANGPEVVRRVLPLNAAEEYWRFRESEGELVFETSSNGVDWPNSASVTSPFPLSAVTLSFGIFDGGAGPGEAIFSELNTPLP